MIIAIFSDVHGNLEALKAVLQDIDRRKVEKVFFLGDAVGYGADPNRCVKMIDEVCAIKLLGNHDYVALGLESDRHFNPMARRSIIWTRETMSKTTSARLSDFEMEAVFLDYYLVHATPDRPADWNYMLTPDEAGHNFRYFSQRFCFVGHSHLPGVFCRRADGHITQWDTAAPFTAEENCRYIINVGSVGQPRDGNRDACYVTLDTDGPRIDFHRVAYDLEEAQKKMRKAQLPEFLVARLGMGK